MATDVRGSLADAIRDLSEWERLRTFPARYRCTEEEYFALDTKQLVEYSDGLLEVPPSPTVHHQCIVCFIMLALHSFVKTDHMGTMIFGFPVRLRPGLFRTPDVVFMRAENTPRLEKRFSKKADLVVEVISEQNRPHDIETKRVEYAQARIPEYRIVDPEEETITVLVLKRGRKTYIEHGKFAKGTRATSKLLPGFSVDVTTAVTQKPELPK
jgi:Uma2 family endonuclease